MANNWSRFAWWIFFLLLTASFISSTWYTTFAQKQFEKNILRALMPYKLVEVCQTNSMALAKGADRSIPKPLGELIIECMITGERKRVRDADIRALLFCKRQNNQQEDAVLGVIYEETGIVSGFDITEHNVLKASSNRMRNVVINDNPHMRAMLTKAIRDLFSHGDIKISPENKK